MGKTLVWYHAGRPGFCCECGAQFEADSLVRPDGCGGLLCGVCGDEGLDTTYVPVSAVYL